MSLERIPRKPGKVMCLGGCNKLFDSIDKFTNRVCPKCTKKLDKERLPRRLSSQIQLDGKTVNLDNEDL